jgi:endonuclease/exonuclease/phosphatase family metal-dependent hydrolase
MKKLRIAVCCILISALLAALSGCGDKKASSDKGGPADGNKVPQPTPSEVSYEGLSRVYAMDFNIYYLDVAQRADNIIKYINKYSPDVMGLQEVTSEWRSYINKAFVDNGKYAYYGYGRYGTDWSNEKQPTNEAYSLILYNKEMYEQVDQGHFWLSTTPNVYSAQFPGVVSKFPRCTNWVRLKDKKTGGEFVFVDVHLDPENETVRQYSTEVIADQLKQIAGDPLVIMVGDWNAQLTSAPINYLTSNGYENVRYTAKETSKLGTWHDWGNRDQNSWLFGDIILASKGKAHVKKFDVLTDKFDGKFISDHNPLTAEIYY